MTESPRRVDINISGVPVAGVGGAGLLVVAAAMGIEFPGVRAALIRPDGFVGGAPDPASPRRRESLPRC